jgi:hypothetical protein
VLLARRDRLDGLITARVAIGPWAAVIGRLRCLRGVDTLTAVGLVAEIGDVYVSRHPKQLPSYEHRPRLARSVLDGGPGAAQHGHEVASPRISV